MKFEDISPFELNLIKSEAVRLLVNSRLNNRYEVLANVIIGYLGSKGYTLEHVPNKIIEKIKVEMSPSHGHKEESADDTIKNILLFLEKHGVVFNKTKESTCSNPNKSWYTPYDNRKKPWVM